MTAMTEFDLHSLLPAQRAIWVAQMIDPLCPFYKIAEYMEIRGPLNVDALRRAGRQAIEEADAIHLRFINTEDGLRQYIDPLRPGEILYFDYSTASDPAAAAREWMQNDLAKATDLSMGPVFAFALFRIETDLHFLYAQSHHICNDGFGAAIFAQRLAEIYADTLLGRPAAPSGAISWNDFLEDEAQYAASNRCVNRSRLLGQLYARRRYPPRHFRGGARSLRSPVLKKTSDCRECWQENWRAPRRPTTLASHNF